jgi:hypothetical protein
VVQLHEVGQCGGAWRVRSGAHVVLRRLQLFSRLASNVRLQSKLLSNGSASVNSHWGVCSGCGICTRPQQHLTRDVHIPLLGLTQSTALQYIHRAARRTHNVGTAVYREHARAARFEATTRVRTASFGANECASLWFPPTGSLHKRGHERTR